MVTVVVEQGPAIAYFDGIVERSRLDYLLKPTDTGWGIKYSGVAFDGATFVFFALHTGENGLECSLFPATRLRLLLAVRR